MPADGVGAFRSAYETGPQARWFEVFQGLAGDGRPVGVHVVVSADRSAAIPANLAALIQRRLVLRLAADGHESALLRVPDGAFTDASPPGRGFLDGAEVQVAVLGGTRSTVAQAAQLAALRDDLRLTGQGEPVAVGRLPERVPLGELPVAVGGQPVLGLGDDTLEPVGFAPSGVLLVAGPSGSGRTSLLATLAMSHRRAQADRVLVLLSPARSALADLVPFDLRADTAEDVATLAKELASAPERCTTLTIVLKNVPEFLHGAAEGALQQLIKTVLGAGGLVVVEGERSALTSAYPLIQAVKAMQHGVALQPDQTDGDLLFRMASRESTERRSRPAAASTSATGASCACSARCRSPGRREHRDLRGAGGAGHPGRRPPAAARRADDEEKSRMSISHGMDVPAVRQLAAQMDQSPTQIEQLMTTLTSTLDGTARIGPDRERFMSEWQSTHCSQLTAVANSLKETATVARVNAQEQEDVSR